MASKSQSPRGPKKFDFGLVGLGIVAALEKSTGDRNDIPALFVRNLSRSNPIPVRNRSEEMEMEEYTIVTFHGPNKSCTKVYSEASRKGDDRTPFRIQSSVNNNRAAVFHISPVRFGDAMPPSDFLSSCDLCHKKLYGKDIYMYRGEKAFCSTECRYRQMVMDERNERCSSEASRPAAMEVAGSPQIYTTGILAI